MKIFPEHARDELYQMFWTILHDNTTRPHRQRRASGTIAFLRVQTQWGRARSFRSLKRSPAILIACKILGANFEQAKRLYVPQAIACDVPTRLPNIAAWSYAAGKNRKVRIVVRVRIGLNGLGRLWLWFRCRMVNSQANSDTDSKE